MQPPTNEALNLRPPPSALNCGKPQTLNALLTPCNLIFLQRPRRPKPQSAKLQSDKAQGKPLGKVYRGKAAWRPGKFVAVLWGLGFLFLIVFRGLGFVAVLESFLSLGLRVGLLLGLWVQLSRAHPRMIIPSLLHVMGSGFSGNLKRLGVRGLRFARCLFIGSPRHLGSYGTLGY